MSKQLKEVSSQQLTYTPIVKSVSELQFTRVPPTTTISANNSLISSTGGNPVDFELNTAGQAVNLSKSILHFTMNPTAPSGGYNYMFMDALTPFQQITLMTKSGERLMDLTEPRNQYKLMWKTDIPFDEYMTFDTFYGTTIPQGSGKFLRPSNGIAAAQGAFSKRPTGNSTTQSRAYVENSYLEIGNSGAVSASPVFDISLDLGMLKNTICALDRSILFNQNLVLRLVFGSTVKVGFTCNSIDTPAADALLGSVNVQDLYINLAFEADQDVANQLRGEINSNGFSIPIPYVNVRKNAMGTSTAGRASFNVSRADGQRLIRIYNSLFRTAETGLDAYNNSINPTILPSYYTQLDGHKLSQYDISLGTTAAPQYMDWHFHQSKFRGCCGYQNVACYRQNWQHIDDWSSKDKLCDADKDLDILGVDLNQEKRYDFVCTKDSTDLTCYSYIVTQKMLVINQLGLQLL